MKLIIMEINNTTILDLIAAITVFKSFKINHSGNKQVKSIKDEVSTVID